MAAPHPEVVDPHGPLVGRVRAICLAYPEVVEVPAWGRVTFRAGKKIFVVTGSSMDRPDTIVFKPEPADDPALRQHPLVFVPPYFGASGWLGYELDHPATDWDEVAELIDASYRQVALKRQLAALDAHPVLR